MKKIIFFSIGFLVLFSFLYGFANQKQETNGLTVQNISFEVDQTQVPTAQVPLNKTFKIDFQGIKGFHEVTENQKKLVFPKMSVIVLTAQHEPILYEENVLEGFAKQGIPSFFSSNLTASISTGEFFQEEEVYQVFIEIQDMKGLGRIEYRTSLMIEKSH